MQINTRKAAFALVLIFLVLAAVIAEEQSTSEKQIGDSEESITDILGVDSKARNVEITKEDGKSSIDFKANGVVSIDGRVYSDFGEVQVIESGVQKTIPPKIVVKDGRVIEAYLVAKKGGKYVFGNEEIYLPQGANFVLKDGKAKIIVSGETKAEELIPKSVDGKPGESDYEFRSSGDIVLANGDRFLAGKGALRYKNGGFYFNEEVSIGELEIKTGTDTRIDFSGKVDESYKGAYISMDRQNGKLVVGCNKDEMGPVVVFKKDNPYGMKIEEGDYAAVQVFGNSEGNYVKIENREKEEKIAFMESLNQFGYEFAHENGKRSVFYNSDTGRLYARAEGGVIDSVKSSGKSAVPLEMKNYKTVEGKVVDVSKYGNFLGVGNRGEIGYGKNPTFIKVGTTKDYVDKGAAGLYTGFSNRLIYNYDLTKKGFERFTGVRLIDQTGVTNKPENIRMIMDVMASVPAEQLRHLKIFEIRESAWWSGLASPGHARVAVQNNGFQPSVIRHEMAHVHDFTFSYSGGFNREWNAVGGPQGPHTYSYGYSGAEDTSTFAEMVYKNSWGESSWKSLLTGKSGTQIKGKLAVFNKYGFISNSEIARILGIAGLPSDSASLNRYIEEAKR